MLENLETKTIEAIFNALPVDMIFADSTNTIRYYNQGNGRIFKRKPEIIGSKVLDCHSQQSRDKVKQVISELRSGRRVSVELKIGNRNGRRIYTRYFPVKDKAGRYLGTLEVAQDITDMQKILDEKR